MARFGCATLSQLQDRVLHEPAAFPALLRVPHRAGQRDVPRPAYFRALREQVVPLLRTYPSLKVWVAGCSTGEEVYSLAILLREEGLLERTLIYATDINPAALQKAEAGVYDVDRIAGFTENHRARAARDVAVRLLHRGLRPGGVRQVAAGEHIVFSDHSLATDSVFAEVQLVSCRNVLIYFDRELQDRALGLFRDALCRRGFLGLGAKESLRFSAHARRVRRSWCRDERIYQKRDDGVSDARLDSRRVDAVVIGASAGGVEALSALLPALPAELAGAGASSSCTCRASGRACWPTIFAPTCALPVREAEDKEPVEPGTVYFAPPDYHLLVDAGRAARALGRRAGATSRGRRSTCCSSRRPTSIGERLLGIVLTGAQRGRRAGLAAIRRGGGVTVVQEPGDRAGADAWPRPRCARCPPTIVLPLERHRGLLAACGRGR